ncbi:hypothetical protein ACFY0R_10300 [Streptomyces sp. NPDC001633]|uniref:hypothetical protein n=1 Tax=Streptomyces sp. NPDC001633 TaxID=3364595 RepID=UPI0036BD8363
MPAPYKEYTGEPLVACAEFLAEGLGADHLVVPGYYPHTQQPEEVKCGDAGAVGGEVSAWGVNVQQPAVGVDPDLRPPFGDVSPNPR